MQSYTYRAEYVNCNSSKCRGCPHGPYWYGYFREDGRLKKKYFGKEDPRPKKQEKFTNPENPFKPEPPHPWEAILDRKTARLGVAEEILGIKPNASYEAARSAYRRRATEHHPDKGGDVRLCTCINAAWEYWRAYHKSLDKHANAR